MASTSVLLQYSLGITLLSSLFIPSNAQASTGMGCPFSSIYSFGDGDSSTSDGLVMVDHLASAFRVPPPNPYMKKDANTKFDYGASFAVAGATVTDISFFTKKGLANSSLDAQLDSFYKLLDSICSSDHQKCAKKLQRALFFVDQIGINDYMHAFLHGKSIKDVSNYVPLFAFAIKNTLKKLIDAGATTLLVPGSLPMGCLPGYMTIFHSDDPIHYDANKCHIGLNTFTRLHNDHLWQTLMELRLEYPHVHILYADYYKSFMAILQNHLLLGFRKQSLMKACCGIGGLYNFHPTKLCGDQGVPVCSEPATYIHWDGFHLTQEAQKNMMDALFSGGSFVYPEFKHEEIVHCIM